MATYKKRSFKKNPTPNNSRSLENKSATANVFNKLDEGSSKTQQWVQDNKNKILVLFAIIVLSVLGFFAYYKFVIEPNEREALNKMYFAQKTFLDEAVLTQSDSLYSVVLNGDGINLGMIDIIENYDGTSAANIANYITGMTYFKIKDYDNAIKFLLNFESESYLFRSLAKGTIGDAYSELNKYSDALEYYLDAANDNNFTTPIYLFKAGSIAMKINKFSKAEELFKRIKLGYPNSPEAANIDAYISKAAASN